MFLFILCVSMVIKKTSSTHMTVTYIQYSVCKALLMPQYLMPVLNEIFITLRCSLFTAPLLHDMEKLSHKLLLFPHNSAWHIYLETLGALTGIWNTILWIWTMLSCRIYFWPMERDRRVVLFCCGGSAGLDLSFPCDVQGSGLTWDPLGPSELQHEVPAKYSKMKYLFWIIFPIS